MSHHSSLSDDVDRPPICSARAAQTGPAALLPGVTVIVPAFNEAATILDTLKSLLHQTIAPAQIIVVDDCSTDATAEVARRCGVVLLRPPVNTGSKAGAQNFALPHVTTEYTLAVDADTIVAADAIEHFLAVMKDRDIAAACGLVVPRHVRTVWERGRYIEYLLAFSFYKPIQDHYGKPLIASGCFSIYRTGVLRAHGGWRTRTMAEDMDLTWTMYATGQRVRFTPAAVCYPIEPHNFSLMRKQLRRWSHGFMQNVQLHWPRAVSIRYLRSAIGVALWESTVASVIYLGVLPLAAFVFQNPWMLLVYVLDAPALLAPVLTLAAQRNEFGRALTSIPSFFLLRVVNCAFVLEAIWSEMIVRRPLLTYEKGH